MKHDTFTVAMWLAAITSVAVAVILYQHAQHTAYIVGLIGGGTAPDMASSPAASLATNDGWNGQYSRASGVWTPLGPAGTSIFPYMPPQSQ